MGEETDIAEPMSSEDVVAAEDVTADEPSKEHRRKRKKLLYKSLLELLEFYMGDVNLSKDRFMIQRIQGQPFVYLELSLFLTFNKVRALTSSVEDLAKALSKSEILQVSEDGTQVCRKTPIGKKENEDDCTIYVEQLPPDIDHDMLTKMFSEYGTVDYVSLPRFSHSSKFKGFAFVEFKDPESAKNAVEAFKKKGCCLSPHMAPEELMSIKNFDNNKENKIGEPKSEDDSAVTKYETDIKNIEVAEAHGSEQHFEPNNSDEHRIGDKGGNDFIKKKRKLSETEEKLTKKIKRSRTKETESKQIEHNISGDSGGEEIKNNDELQSELNVTPKDKEKVVKSDTTQSNSSDKNNQSDCEGKLHTEKRKRKHSDNAMGSSSDLDKTGEGSEPTRKKLKSDTEEPSQSEDNNGEDETAKQKKKRKKKKKIRKEKSTAITRGLKVLPKKEWKALRNKYLNMQRNMMRSLKQRLMYSKWEKSKALGSEAEEVSTKRAPKFTSEPGTVVKVTLEQPVANQTSAKSEMRIHPDIRYIDVTEGSPTVYLRATTPQLAASLVQSRHWPAMDILQGDEETEYWKKMNTDREEQLKKSKPNQRGRTKLLKRAERFQGKHITTFESS